MAGTSMGELAPRHVAALTAMAIGLPQNVAVRRLGVSRRTLGRWLDDAESILGADSTTHAVALAVAAGLIDHKHLANRTVPDVIDKGRRVCVRVMTRRGPMPVGRR